LRGARGLDYRIIFRGKIGRDLPCKGFGRYRREKHGKNHPGLHINLTSNSSSREASKAFDNFLVAGGNYLKVKGNYSTTLQGSQFFKRWGGKRGGATQKKERNKSP